MKHRNCVTIPALALAALAVACGESTPAAPAPPEAARPEAAAKPATPQAPVPAPAPAAVPAAASPQTRAPAAAGDAARGKALYAQYCASCHGAGGNADGPLGQALNPHPAKHSDGATMNPLSDEHLFKVIQLGGPAVGKSPLMAPWGGMLSEAQIRDLIAFVRTLAVPPYPGR